MSVFVSSPSEEGSSRETLLLTSDVSKRLKIPQARLRRMMRLRYIPSVRIGGRWYIPENALGLIKVRAVDKQGGQLL